MYSWTLLCILSLVVSVLHHFPGYQFLQTLNHCARKEIHCELADGTSLFTLGLTSNVCCSESTSITTNFMPAIVVQLTTDIRRLRQKTWKLVLVVSSYLVDNMVNLPCPTTTSMALTFHDDSGLCSASRNHHHKLSLAPLKWWLTDTGQCICGDCFWGQCFISLTSSQARQLTPWHYWREMLGKATRGGKRMELLHNVMEGKDYGRLKDLISDGSRWRHDSKWECM